MLIVQTAVWLQSPGSPICCVSPECRKSCIPGSGAACLKLPIDAQVGCESGGVGKCSWKSRAADRTGAQAIVEVLTGCKVVVTAMIGDYPRQELEKAGMVHVATTGPVELAVLAAHHQLCGCGCRCAGEKQCVG